MGFRILAFAIKELPNDINYDILQKSPEETFYNDLKFLGLVAFYNNIKSDCNYVM